jgi:hypothetical protein
VPLALILASGFCARSICALATIRTNVLTNMSGRSYCVSCALVGASRLCARSICALTAFRANVLTGVRRNNDFVLCALILANVLCAICIEALATFRACILTNVMTCTLILANILCAYCIKALAAFRANIVTYVILCCINYCNVVKVDTAIRTAKVVCTCLGNSEFVLANSIAYYVALLSNSCKSAVIKSCKTESSCCGRRTGNSINYDGSRIVCNDLYACGNRVTGSLHSTAKLKSQGEGPAVNSLAVRLDNERRCSRNACAYCKLCACSSVTYGKVAYVDSNVVVKSYLVTCTLTYASILCARIVCALTALRTYVLASVRRYVTCALIFAYIFFAILIRALTTLRAYIVTSVRRNNCSVSFALVGASTLCAILIGAPATIRAHALALML